MREKNEMTSLDQKMTFNKNQPFCPAIHMDGVASKMYTTFSINLNRSIDLLEISPVNYALVEDFLFDFYLKFIEVHESKLSKEFLLVIAKE